MFRTTEQFIEKCQNVILTRMLLYFNFKYSKRQLSNSAIIKHNFAFQQPYSKSKLELNSSDTKIVSSVFFFFTLQARLQVFEFCQIKVG